MPTTENLEEQIREKFKENGCVRVVLRNGDEAIIEEIRDDDVYCLRGRHKGPHGSSDETWTRFGWYVLSSKCEFGIVALWKPPVRVNATLHVHRGKKFGGVFVTTATGPQSSHEYLGTIELKDAEVIPPRDEQ